MVYSQIHNKNKINITYEDFFHQLTTQYGFLPDDDIFREVHKMSGLEQMIIQDARKEGIEQGIKQGIEQGIEQGKEKGIDLTLNTIGLLIEKLTLANDEENLKRLPFLFKDRQEIQKLFNQYNISLA